MSYWLLTSRSRMLPNEGTKLFANNLILAASRGQADCMFDKPDPYY